MNASRVARPARDSEGHCALAIAVPAPRGMADARLTRPRVHGTVGERTAPSRSRPGRIASVEASG